MQRQGENVPGASARGLRWQCTQFKSVRSACIGQSEKVQVYMHGWGADGSVENDRKQTFVVLGVSHDHQILADDNFSFKIFRNRLTPGVITDAVYRGRQVR